ncbi:MAG: squalene--hopene cyclase [Salinivirgaceae bacterium]|jgi:prenyltransferase beta subunit|nr:squalene--hopene cyclase [Salinivirgaceae bacterium]
MTENENANIKRTIRNLHKNLLSQRNDKGVWDGQLSSSALAVAVAIFSLWKYSPKSNSELISGGLQWLKNNINSNGGYGDTIKSKSNLSTSLLCWSAFSIVKDNREYQTCIEQLENYIIKSAGSLEPNAISQAILKHYASDKTFSVPILAMCALAGRLGETGWKFVPQLPYQFAALPHILFRWLNLNVVSYAIPALISMGIIKQKMNPSRNPLARLINHILEPKLLRVLAEKQPDNGGFLEAIPLTAFVLMTLVGAGLKNSAVCAKAEAFLQYSVRNDGSFPIDTSLTTWVTTLAVNALSKEQFNALDEKDKTQIKDWLLNQQHKTVHSFTKTAPGGWAWIDTPGGVADGDDTSGALIALKKLMGNTEEGIASARMGLTWLLGIQNKDGGFPTFCKGWGKLPFDASCPDITAHVIRAILEWKDDMDNAISKKLEKSLNKAILYLKNTQKRDGTWVPLWFGNEHDKNHKNRVYGTSLVLIGLCIAKQKGFSELDRMIDLGSLYLHSNRNNDGGWGGHKDLPSTLEETALATKALCLSKRKVDLSFSTNWLCEECYFSDPKPSPIGLYFASLWYHEKLYPLTYTLGALNTVSDILIT